MTVRTPLTTALLLLVLPLNSVMAADRGEGWRSFGRQGFICIHRPSSPVACHQAKQATTRLSATPILSVPPSEDPPTTTPPEPLITEEPQPADTDKDNPERP